MRFFLRHLLNGGGSVSSVRSVELQRVTTTPLSPCSVCGSLTQGRKKPYTASPPPLCHARFCIAVTHLTNSGAFKHKSPLFQPLEHCPFSWRPEKVQRRWHGNLGVTVCCVLMVLKCSAFLPRSKVLFPAHVPVFSSPVRGPHN